MNVVIANIGFSRNLNLSIVLLIIVAEADLIGTNFEIFRILLETLRISRIKGKINETVGRSDD